MVWTAFPLAPRYKTAVNAALVKRNMKPHKSIYDAIKALAKAREHFAAAKKQGLVLGNDNHIGDIGEYWVMELLKKQGEFKCFAPKKNSPYDIELNDGRRVSVKTITEWAESGKGTQIKPLCGSNWSILMAVHLNNELMPTKIAKVTVNELLEREPFISNVKRREKGTKTYPRFEWWEWLDEYLAYQLT